MINPPASFDKPERGSIRSKTQTVNDKARYIEASIEQFKTKLSNEIKTVIKMNKISINLNMSYFKELGVVDAAEKKSRKM